MKGLIILFSLMMGSLSWADTDVRSFLSKVHDQYQQCYRANFEVNILQPGKSPLLQKGEVRIDPIRGYYYSNYANNTIIKTDQESVLVSKTEKSVYYQTIEKDKENYTDYSPLAIVDSLLKYSTNDIELIDLGGKRKRLIHKNPMPEIEEAQYQFEGHKLIKATFYYNKKKVSSVDKVEVKYSNVAFANIWPTKDFPLDLVIQKKGKKRLLTPSYSNYQLINVNELLKEY